MTTSRTAGRTRARRARRSWTRRYPFGSHPSAARGGGRLGNYRGSPLARGQGSAPPVPRLSSPAGPSARRSSPVVSALGRTLRDRPRARVVPRGSRTGAGTGPTTHRGPSSRAHRRLRLPLASANVSRPPYT